MAEREKKAVTATGNPPRPPPPGRVIFPVFIDAAWDEVTSCVEERKQQLELSDRNLEAFRTAEPQLQQWLSEKELMMSVLGPLSMYPNMMKMQRQQVQVTRARQEEHLSLIIVVVVVVVENNTDYWWRVWKWTILMGRYYNFHAIS